MRAISPAERNEIWWHTSLVAVGYAVLVWLAVLRLEALGAVPPVRAMVVGFFATQMLIVFVLSLRTLWTKGWDELSERFHARLRPAIAEAIAACCAGQSCEKSWEQLLRRAPREFEKALLHALTVVSGPARERLAARAERAGLAAYWWNALAERDRELRLHAVEALALLGAPGTGDKLLPLLYDRDLSIQVLAGKTILAEGAPEPVARVYRHAVEGPPLLRLLLEPAMRPHSNRVCRYVLQALTPTLTPRQWCAALELARLWRQSLTPELLDEALQHTDAGVRKAALAVAAQDEAAASVRGRLECALADPEADVRRSAAALAGQTQLLSLIPALARELDSTVPENSITAAAALVALGRAAEPVLRERVQNGVDLPRQSAMEALSRQRLGKPMAVCA